MLKFQSKPPKSEKIQLHSKLQILIMKATNSFMNLKCVHKKVKTCALPIKEMLVNLFFHSFFSLTMHPLFHSC